MANIIDFPPSCRYRNMRTKTMRFSHVIEMRPATSIRKAGLEPCGWPAI